MRQSELGEFDPNFPSSLGPVTEYHGTIDMQNVLDQGIRGGSPTRRSRRYVPESLRGEERVSYTTDDPDLALQFAQERAKKLGLPASNVGVVGVRGGGLPNAVSHQEPAGGVFAGTQSNVRPGGIPRSSIVPVVKSEKKKKPALALIISVGPKMPKKPEDTSKPDEEMKKTWHTHVEHVGTYEISKNTLPIRNRAIPGVYTFPSERKLAVPPGRARSLRAKYMHEDYPQREYDTGPDGPYTEGEIDIMDHDPGRGMSDISDPDPEERDFLTFEEIMALLPPEGYELTDGEKMLLESAQQMYPDYFNKADTCDCCSPATQAFGALIDGHFEKAKKKSKPFHGYNPKRHHKKGGLNAAGRAKFKRETGANLKPPVTTKPSKLKPGSKRAKRRKSFCARMSGSKGPTSKDGKLTPKGAALKRWNC